MIRYFNAFLQDKMQHPLSTPAKQRELKSYRHLCIIMMDCCWHPVGLSVFLDVPDFERCSFDPHLQAIHVSTSSQGLRVPRPRTLDFGMRCSDAMATEIKITCLEAKVCKLRRSIPTWCSWSRISFWTTSWWKLIKFLNDCLHDSLLDLPRE